MDHSLFKVKEDVQTQCVTFGKEKQPLLIVDSFMDGAEALKNHAIEHNQFDLKENFYPGSRMAIPLIYTAALAKNLNHYIEQFFGLNLKSVKTAASRFSIVTTPPNELSLLQCIPHFDSPSKNSLAMVHYLCDSSKSGTAFYRHNETGYEYIDQQRQTTYKRILDNQYANEDKQPKGYISGNTSEFEQVISCDAVFNRLIMYRGSSLHSGIIDADYDFDPHPATGRLTITSFIEF